MKKWFSISKCKDDELRWNTIYLVENLFTSIVCKVMLFLIHFFKVKYILSRRTNNLIRFIPRVIIFFLIINNMKKSFKNVRDRGDFVFHE